MENIIILNNSNRLHISHTHDALDEICRIRRIPQNRMESFNSPFVYSCLEKAHDKKRGQVDVEKLMYRISKSEDIHKENSDALKIVLTDHDIYSSRKKNNFGFGAMFPYSLENRYVIVSTARMVNTDHARQIIGHEIGHAFGAPDPHRTDIYESLGNHCIRDNCTMYQSLNLKDSINQSKRVVYSGRPYCPSCVRDIMTYGKDESLKKE